VSKKIAARLEERGQILRTHGGLTLAETPFRHDTSFPVRDPASLHLQLLVSSGN
jgi:hypothetical protein